MRIGIVGLGRFGFAHAENLAFRMRGVELHAACGSHWGRLEKNQQLLEIPVITADYDEFESLLPTFDTVIQVGHHRRWDPSYIDAKQRIDDGYLGKIISYRNENRDYYFDPDFYRRLSPDSGGTIVDTGSHDYDMARWLNGSEATGIYGIRGAYVYDVLPEMGDVDNATLLMEFDNGMMGHFSYSRNCTYAYHVETEIYGTDGVFRVCADPLNNRLISIDEKGQHRTLFKDAYDLYRNCYYDEMTDFIECVRSGTQPKVTAADGIKSVRWALRATQAVRERGAVAL